MTKFFSFLTFILLIWGSFNVHAQQAIAVTGGDATGVNGSVAYTIGQVDYISASGVNGNINEGVQQPIIIGVVTGIDNKEINLNCAISPNPSADFVVLSVNKDDLHNLSFGLYDLKGQLIKSGRVTERNTTISLTEYADALYLMKVYSNDNEVKSFKLIKNK